MNKKIIAFTLAMALTLSLAGCVKDKTSDDKDNIKNNPNTEQTNQEQEPDSIGSTVKIDNTNIQEALKSHTFLSKNFTFEEQHNQVIEKVADTENYINSETWIYSGILNEGITDLTIENSKADYAISITTEGNNDYPSNISITFTSLSDTDLDNMLSWSYQLIGEILPPKLSSAFQNSAFSGLTENCYNENGIKADVFKENTKNEDSSVTTNLNIIMSYGVDEVTYANIDQFIIDKGSRLGIYDLNVFDYNSTVENMLSRLSSLFGANTDTKVEIISTYNKDGIDKNTESVYCIFDTADENNNINTTIIINGNTELVSGKSTKSINIETDTINCETPDEAYKAAEVLINGLLGSEITLEDIYDKSSGEVTISEPSKTIGFPVKLSVLLNSSNNMYSVHINIVTTNQVSDSAENSIE